MTPGLEKEGPVVSKDKPKGPQKKQRGPKNNQGKANWHRTYPQGYRIPKVEPSAVDSVFNMARTPMEFTSKEQERMQRTFTKKIDETRYNKSIIDVKFNKVKTELKKFTSAINDLKKLQNLLLNGVK
ncbi:hypothetical protein O181_002189 [Austropuccinia psidii MF-1]|uniref:Uncharacterized protein n=1 Tax=Austropuccinia psidii MF-1 TaxID=1389203 RepID=A0A9Q3GCL8_9BASI|nr:hypothetical protein [Austropuccinia psidii MF-1]